MTTSEPRAAFVWVWLPGSLEPVVCGRLDQQPDGRISFAYGRSYLARTDAVALYAPELPLRTGVQYGVADGTLPLCIDDAMPDAWGRRLVNFRHGQITSDFGDLTYLLESGSDRIGALDFQASPTEYVAREASHPTLDDLADAAERIENGQPLGVQLTEALLHGTSVGGARPKALVRDGERRLIAKFSSTSDLYPTVQGEYVAMELARRVGLDVAPVQIVRAAGRQTLLVERFDRGPAGDRRQMVSVLTILGLTPFPGGRYATYVDLAYHIRASFVRADTTLHELFARICFNILCGNTDDHGRNHAAFVSVDGLTLTPAYDICPQARSGESASQAMAFGQNGEREAQVSLLINSAAIYHLRVADARELVDHQIATIRDNWTDVCDAAELTEVERQAFLGRQFLNPLALQ
jgi:serine/threonine-protein kinase HipA